MPSRHASAEGTIAGVQSNRVMAGILAGLVAMPSSLLGHLVRVGDHARALQVFPLTVAVILIAAAIMHQRQRS